MRTRTALLLVPVICLVGCTLINALDETTRIADVTPTVSDGAVAPLPVGSKPTVSGDAGPDSTTVDGAVPALAGAVVVGGELFLKEAGAIHDYVLTVLDPKTGAELAPSKREPMAVAAIRYDGLRDLWYIFESTNGDFVPTQGSTVYLHVRTLDATGTWTELSKTVVPVPHFYETIAVVRERLGYVSYKGDGGTGVQFVTLDTSNPAAVTVTDELPLAKAPTVAVGTRSTTGPGGTINLLQVNTTACPTGTPCDVQMIPVRISNGGQTLVDAPITVGTMGRSGAVSGAAHTQRTRVLVVTPPAPDAGTGLATLAQLVDPVNGNPSGPAIPFTMTDSSLRRAAVAECQDVGFVIGTNNDLDLHAFSLAEDGGPPTTTPTGHSGQAIYFEPFTATVLSPFSQGDGFDYTAFRLDLSVPQLPKRTTDWNPPADVRPLLLGIRHPLPFACP